MNANNSMMKMWLIMGTIDIVVTVFTYFMLVGSWFVYISIIPTILFLALALPLQRIANQINEGIDKQNGICFNCNQKMNRDTCSLEDDDHVYCEDCHKKLFGHLYEQIDGVWYKKTKEKESQS